MFQEGKEPWRREHLPHESREEGRHAFRQNLRRVQKQETEGSGGWFQSPPGGTRQGEGELMYPFSEHRLSTSTYYAPGTLLSLRCGQQ